MTGYLQVRIGPTGTTNSTLSKRTRKKKTLAELKEDESLLLKERGHLKRELEALHMKLANERVNNECLKRQKASTTATLIPLENVASNDPNVSSRIFGQHSSVPPVPITTCRQQQRQEGGCNVLKNAGFVIPDLNMPFEDSFACEVQAGAAS